MSNTSVTWSPTALVVVTNTSTMVDIAYTSSMGELHYVVRDGVNGFYSYFVTGNMGGAVAEFRTLTGSIRACFPTTLTWYARARRRPWRRSRPRPSSRISTYQLADGSIYTKYDYCDYVVNDRVHGVFGSNYGLWVIPVSTEALNGGPMKQELMVHVESNSGMPRP